MRNRSDGRRRYPTKDKESDFGGAIRQIPLPSSELAKNKGRYSALSPTMHDSRRNRIISTQTLRSDLTRRIGRVAMPPDGS
jgi:hypothetical protein